MVCKGFDLCRGSNIGCIFGTATELPCKCGDQKMFGDLSHFIIRKANVSIKGHLTQ